MRDFALALPLGPRFWFDAAKAVAELARANRIHRHTPVERLQLMTAESTRAHRPLSKREWSLVARVAYVVPLMGARVPWRSDCLVQALAARHWLSRASIPSDLCIGVRKDELGFEAHAWLKVGDQIVIGGDTSTYAELRKAESEQNQSLA